jgi:hypothetical protein
VEKLNGKLQEDLSSIVFHAGYGARKKNCHRRFKARFVSMREECERTLECGNRSALKTLN